MRAIFKNGKFISGHHFTPSKTSIPVVANLLVELIEREAGDDVEKVILLERYVAYAKVHNSASEQILMLIGALLLAFAKAGYKVLATRAIDWKTKLCKHLFVEKGFKNPGKDFGKVYSMAAAKELTGREFKNDHIADAVCLGYSATLPGLKCQVLYSPY